MKRAPDNLETVDAEEPTIIRERIIERNGNGNGWLIKAIVVSVIAGLGAVIWAQQQKIEDHATAIAVLKTKCPEQPITRGGEGTIDYERCEQ